MAKKLLTSYTFTPGAANAGTLVVAGTYALEQFLLVTNVTTGATIYQFNSAAKGGAVSSSGGNTTLTLEYNTSAMSSSDRLQVFIDDGLNPQFTLTNASVEISNDVGNAVPVSAASLPLPTGAATEANQTTANTSLSSIDGKLPALSSGRVPVDVGNSINVGEVEIKNDAGNPVPIDGSGVIQPVSDNGILDALKADIDSPNIGIGLLLQEGVAPDPLNPSGPALQVTLRDQVQLDPSVPAVIGGIDPTGTTQRARVGTDGGLQLTDGKQFVGTAQALNGTPTGWIDTTGYQSIVVTFFGAPSANVGFQGTNDFTSPSSNVGGWPVAGTNVPASTLVNPGSGSTWQFPVTSRYFRILVTNYTSGIVGAVVTLRSAPAVFIPNNQGISGYDFGGTVRRILTDSLGNQQVIGGLPIGYQYNTNNATYGRYTQTISSQTASQSTVQPVIVGGFDSAGASRSILLDNAAPNLGAVAVTSAPSTPAQQSIHELLYQILATLRASAHYQYEAAFGDKPRSVGDEPDNLIGEYLNQSSQFTNLTN